MGVILRLGKEGEIPTRITHNDTKFNNILLDSNDRALCVIDLDTVMPGYIHYDFGDAIRTTATISAEDETDLNKVELDIDLFEAYAEGYLSEIVNVLKPAEIEYLAFAPRLITFTIGLRFLTIILMGINTLRFITPNITLREQEHSLNWLKAMKSIIKRCKAIVSNIIEKIK